MMIKQFVLMKNSKNVNSKYTKLLLAISHWRCRDFFFKWKFKGKHNSIHFTKQSNKLNLLSIILNDFSDASQMYSKRKQML